MSDATRGVFDGVASLTEDDIEKSGTGDLSIMGFSMMCAWHFLVIFTAMPVTGVQALEGKSVILQLTLLLSLTLSYGLLALGSKKIIVVLYRRGERRWKISNIGIGVIASAASALTILPLESNFPLHVGAFILLGISGALLMFPWLQLPQVRDDKTGNYRNLCFNMGIGSIVAILIANLQAPFLSIALCALPLLANFLLIAYWNEKDTLKNDTESSMDGTRHFKAGDIVTSNFHFIVTGIVFGLCQSMFSHDLVGTGNLTYVANGMFPLLGLPLSAIIIYAMPSSILKSHGVFAIQRTSTLVFFAAIIVFLYFAMSAASLSSDMALGGILTSQAVFLCGFNLFDFGFMVFAFTWAARLKTDFATYIGYNRAMLYLSMAVGMVLGWLCVSFLGGIPNLPIIATGVAGLLLMMVSLPFFDNLAPYGKVASVEEIRKEEAQKREEAQKVDEQAHAARWRQRVENIADEYKLSKREREVFGYLAKGRNASYIQQELWISIHTVKTHMFNIYRKLDVHSIQEIIDMVDKRDDEPSTSDEN